MKNNTALSGFSIVELILIIAIVGILAVLSFTYSASARPQARDAERTSDAESIARQFEANYFIKATSAGPTYPSTTDLTNSFATTFAGADIEITRAPSQTSSSLINASSTASQTPAVNQYIYQPFTSTGSLCSVTPCVRFIIYYRKETDNSIQKVESIHQQ